MIDKDDKRQHAIYTPLFQQMVLEDTLYTRILEIHLLETATQSHNNFLANNCPKHMS